MTKRADQLAEGDWFGDPDRAPYEDGTLRPAKVMQVHDRMANGDVFLTLDDHHPNLGPWVHSYAPDTTLTGTPDEGGQP